MTCAEAAGNIDLFLDGELSQQEAAELSAHLATCEGCFAEHELQRTYRERMRLLAPAPAPRRLRAAVVSLLAGARVPRSRRLRGAIAGGLVAAAAAVALLSLLVEGRPEASPLVRDIAASHERDLPLEVLGPDEGSVASYFRDKVAFPVQPPVFPDNSSLLGARVSTLEARSAAHLLYSVRGRKLSVLVFPSPVFRVPAAERRRIRGREVSFVQAGGTTVALSVDGRSGLGYATAAKVPLEEMERIVNAAYRW